MGFRKKEEKKYIGAKDKMLAARKARFEGGDNITSKIEGPQPTESMPIMLIFVASCLLAYILTDNYMVDSSLISPTGIVEIDKMIGGPGVPAVTGMSEIDYGIIIFIRGLFIFILAGIIPLLTRIYINMVDKARTNVLVRVWGTIVTTGLFAFGLTTSIIPLIKEIIDNFIS